MRIATRRIVLWVMLIFAQVSGISQGFEEFKKSIREEYNVFEEQTQQKFNDFVSRIDAEYTNYLLESIGTYPVQKPQDTDISPKPVDTPVYDDEVSISNALEYNFAPTVSSIQGPILPSIQKSESDNFNTLQLEVNFLGWPLVFDIDTGFDGIKMAPPSPEWISELWEDMAGLNYNHFLAQVSSVAETLNLNTWGYYQLIKACSKQLYNDNDRQVAFQWAMLTRSRYKSRVGFNDRKLYLLIPSVYPFYNMDFINFNGDRYYVCDGRVKELQTYDRDFPETDILMNVRISRPFYTDPIPTTRTYTFSYKNIKHQVALQYDAEMVKFYKTIPLSDISVYFTSVVNHRTEESALEAFKPLLKDLNETESLNLLLSFVQQSFSYRSDLLDGQGEQYLFPDQVLDSRYSDCEDRAILFAFLVRTCLNKEVYAVSYPGHMATAVEVSTKPDGQYFLIGNRFFVLADPTFVGAPVGITISQARNEQATIISLVNDELKEKLITEAWTIANQMGVYKSDRLKDAITDKDASVLLCGYSLNESSDNSESDTKDRQAVVLKISPEGKVQWMHSFSGDGNTMANSIVVENNRIYVSGSFEKTILIGDQLIQSISEPDLFLMALNSEGNPLWAVKAGIDKVDHSSDFQFAALFDTSGIKLMARLYSHMENYTNYGLSADENGNLLITGSFYASPGLSHLAEVSYESGETLDIPETLYRSDRELKEQAYESAIAGLFSALEFVSSYPIAIEGKIIQTTFDTYNQPFTTYAEGLYQNLGTLRFIKNDRGIITIKTKEGNPLIIDKIKIADEARIRIIQYKSGNLKVEVLSGIYVGRKDYWLDMNSVKLFKDTGDLLLTFDTDNSVKQINLKKEILNQ